MDSCHRIVQHWDSAGFRHIVDPGNTTSVIKELYRVKLDYQDVNFCKVAQILKWVKCATYTSIDP